MKKTLLFAILLIVGLQSAWAKDYKRPSFKTELVCWLGDVTPTGVKVKGSTQGMAIWKNYAFVFHDGGQCVVFNLKKRSYVSTFLLTGNQSHCNNASFGVEKYDKDSKFPLVYISECSCEHRCYVTDISLTGSRVVQTIYYTGKGYTSSFDWFVDRKNGFIYTYGISNKDKKIMKFRLPKLSDSDKNGEVRLTQADVLEEFNFQGVNIYQGSRIKGRYTYLADGYAPHDRLLHVLDMKERHIVASLNVNNLEYEPEGVDIKGKWLYMALNVPKQSRNGMIYRFKIK